MLLVVNAMRHIDIMSVMILLLLFALEVTTPLVNRTNALVNGFTHSVLDEHFGWTS
jgi:hypothetical protein